MYALAAKQVKHGLTCFCTTSDQSFAEYWAVQTWGVIPRKPVLIIKKKSEQRHQWLHNCGEDRLHRFRSAIKSGQNAWTSYLRALKREAGGLGRRPESEVPLKWWWVYHFSSSSILQPELNAGWNRKWALHSRDRGRRSPLVLAWA